MKAHPVMTLHRFNGAMARNRRLNVLRIPEKTTYCPNLFRLGQALLLASPSLVLSKNSNTKPERPGYWMLLSTSTFSLAALPASSMAVSQ